MEPVAPPTGGDEDEDVEEGCLDAVELQAVHLLREADEVAAEATVDARRVRPPRVEVDEVIGRLVVPVDGRHHDAALRLAEAQDLLLVALVQLAET